MPFDTTEIDDPMGWKPVKEALKPSESVLPPSELAANIKSALSRGLRWITPVAPHDGIAVICAGGPSLIETADHAKIRHVRDGASIVAINGAVQYLHERRVPVWGCILLDPQPVLADQIEVVPDVTWLVASQCHPMLFDKLAGEDVFLWHADADCDVSGLCGKYRDDFPIIPGGSTAALRALHLLHCMGFREFHYYGLDGSFSENRHHAYDQPEDDGMPIKIVKVKDGDTERTFISRKDYIRQADEFITLCDQATELYGRAAIKLFVHGDGLIPFIWRQRRRNRGRPHDVQG